MLQYDPVKVAQPPGVMCRATLSFFDERNLRYCREKLNWYKERISNQCEISSPNEQVVGAMLFGDQDRWKKNLDNSKLGMMYTCSYHMHSQI